MTDNGLKTTDSAKDMLAAVLVVTGNSDFVNRCTGLLSEEEIAVYQASSVPDALFCVRKEKNIDLVVVDACQDGPDALELVRKLKNGPSHSLLPVIALLTDADAQSRLNMLQNGADDCLTEPFHDVELVQRCRNLIRNKQASDALEDSENVIFALARITEGRDRYTQGHVERVAAYSVEIGNRFGLPERDIVTLNRGGVVHDLGKIAVPDAVLNKPGKLEAHEWVIMKSHPVVGFDILSRLRTFHDVLPIVRWHHEKPNGKGYPDGIGGDELPLNPRITAVADCFDALTTIRPYHQALSPLDAMAIITEAVARDEFDREAAAVMKELVGEMQGAFALSAQPDPVGV